MIYHTDVICSRVRVPISIIIIPIRCVNTACVYSVPHGIYTLRAGLPLVQMGEVAKLAVSVRAQNPYKQGRTATRMVTW